MAYASVDAIKKAVALVNNYDEKEAQKVRDAEQQLTNTRMLWELIL